VPQELKPAKTKNVAKPTPFERVIRPFQRFASQEASGGIVLILATVAALVVANSGANGSYLEWLKSAVSVEIGTFRESNTVLQLINDGLMAVFFLVVGLEIKRELLTGELSTIKQAALPLAAALGGMRVPAAVYLAFNHSGPSKPGWGVPMATDIAFALGVLALLGDRVPYGLKVFLAALAIVDDIGAVLVIAVFYSHGIDANFLIGAGWCVLALGVSNWIGVRSLIVYMVGGLAMWWCLHHSGLHGTVAGVVTAFLIPAKSRIDVRGFLDRAKQYLSCFETAKPGERVLSGDLESSLHSLERAIERVTTPLQRLLHMTHPWVAFLIVPLFAFANAGIGLSQAQFLQLSGDSLALGVIIGLVVGKPLGIVGFSWLALKLKLASLPDGVRMPHVIGAGLLGGIGFTMAIFIASLAFPEPGTLVVAKTAILVASLVSGLLGFVFLMAVSRKRKA